MSIYLYVQHKSSHGVRQGPDTMNANESRSAPYRYGGEGGILTQPLLLSYHLFSNMHKNRMNTGDSYGLALCNSFNCSA